MSYPLDQTHILLHTTEVNLEHIKNLTIYYSLNQASDTSISRLYKRMNTASAVIHKALLSMTWAEKRNCRQSGY